MTENTTYGYVEEDRTEPAQEQQKAKRLSPLDRLKEAIKTKDLYNPKTYQVEGYDFDIQLRFNAYITSDEFKSFQKRAAGAKNRKARRSGEGGDTDPFALFSAILQEKSEAIIINGDEVFDAEGDLVTLRSDEFISLVQDSKIGADVTRVSDAIEAFLTAGNIILIGESIVNEAGFGGEIDPVNP